MSNFKPFKIVFELDGSGIIWDENSPIMLDSLVAYALRPFKTKQRHLTRDDAPDDFNLPFAMWKHGNSRGWCASALFLDGEIDKTIEYWRKRFRLSFAPGLIEGSPNLSNGKYRDYNVPMQKILCNNLVAYGYGNRKSIQRELRRSLKYLGKKKAYGFGRIEHIDSEYIDKDASLVRDGKAMRWLPDLNGLRMVRTFPPYWHPHNVVNCCEIGDEYDISQLTIK